MWFLTGVFTNIVSFSNVSGVNQELGGLSLSNFQPTMLQMTHILLFNAQMIYIFMVYFMMAMCNPGRIESAIERQFLNARFYRLEEHLKLQQEQEEEEMLEKDALDHDGNPRVSKAKKTCLIEDAFDNLLYMNSFEPSDVINYKMKDNRHFRFCEHC